MTKVYLTELEWLGVELALERYLLGQGRSSHAKILARLVRRAGITCRFEDLYDTKTSDGLKVRVSQLRKELRQMGFTVVIENVRGSGYRMSEAHARQIVARVDAAAVGRLAA